MTLDLYPKPKSAPSPTNPSLINDRSNFGEFWASSRRSFFSKQKNPLFWYRFLLQGPSVDSSLPFHSLRVLSTLFFLTPSGRLGVWGQVVDRSIFGLLCITTNRVCGKGRVVALACCCMCVRAYPCLACVPLLARALCCCLLVERMDGWMDGMVAMVGWGGGRMDGNQQSKPKSKSWESNNKPEMGRGLPAFLVFAITSWVGLNILV